MAGSLNKVMLIGNVGRDPEMRYTQSGEAVTTFSLATNRRRTSEDGQRRDETEWHNIVAFGKLAEQCNEFLSKGRSVYIEGRIQTRSWDDQATGQKRYRTEILANMMQMLDSRADRARESGMGGTDDRGGGATDDRGGGADDNAIDLDDTPF
ncbi:MAG: single-stranded DNA-binding protein [Chloroflexota bacterium]